MKKKSEKRIVTAIITGIAAVIALVCGAVFSACGGSSKILETPTNLQIADEYLTWDEVEDAKSYVVEINGTEYETQTNSLDIMEITNQPLTYKFTVFAIGDNKKIYDSDPSEEIEYTVFEPQNLVLEKLSNGTYKISVTNSEEIRKSLAGKLIIPEYVENKIITAIAVNGFRQCPNITSVYIPDGIKSIGDAAFQLCTSASRIRLPKDLQKISDSTFKGCTALKEIAVPKDVTSIGWEAFGSCSSLKKIDLPTKLTNIYGDAFRECCSLQSLVFPNTMKNYSPTWTYDCDSLNHIEIVGGENEEFKSDGNCIIRKKDNVLVYGCNGSVIPDYVTEIRTESFLHCSGMTELNIPENITKIGQSAFGYCSNLRSVTFSEGLTTVCCLAFENCENLESVYVSSTVQNWGVGDNKVYLSTKRNVFPKCPKLKTLTVAESNPYFESNGNCIISKADKNLVEGCTGSEINPEYVTVIGDYAFSECETLSEITIPYGVTEIGVEAFAFCLNVREIYIPNSVKVIKKGAFKRCCYASAVIPESVTSMEGDAFGGVGSYAVFKDWTNNPEGISDSGYATECMLAYDEGSTYPYVYSVKFSSGHHLELNVYGYVAPLRKGYTFLGWAEEEGSTQADIKVETVALEHIWENRKHGIIKHSHNVRVTLRPNNYEEIKGKTYYAVWQKNN